jgi:hypothetical protein
LHHNAIMLFNDLPMYIDDEEEGKTDAEQEKATCNEEEDPIPLIGASRQALA